MRLFNFSFKLVGAAFPVNEVNFRRCMSIMRQELMYRISKFINYNRDSAQHICSVGRMSTT